MSRRPRCSCVGNYVWSDGTKRIEWSIARASVTLPAAAGRPVLSTMATQTGVVLPENALLYSSPEHLRRTPENTLRRPRCSAAERPPADGTSDDKQIAWSIARACHAVAAGDRSCSQWRADADRRRVEWRTHRSPSPETPGGRTPGNTPRRPRWSAKQNYTPGQTARATISRSRGRSLGGCISDTTVLMESFCARARRRSACSAPTRPWPCALLLPRRGTTIPEAAWSAWRRERRFPWVCITSTRSWTKVKTILFHTIKTTSFVVYTLATR